MRNSEEKNLNLIPEEECNTGAYAIRTDRPFVTTKKELKRNQPTAEMIARTKFIDTHDFYCKFDPDNKICNIVVTKKEKSDQ